MNMRKIIAVLAAVLMLCTIIPMSAVSVSAAGVLDVNFDDGEVVFSINAADTAVVEDGVLHWTTASWKNMYTNFRTVVGTEYVLTFKAKADADAMVNFVFLDGSWANTSAPTYQPVIGTEWATYTYNFTPAYSGNVLILQSHKATDIYLDDIKIVEYVAPVDPEIPDDAIYFENFEGTHTWASGANATGETVAATDAPLYKGENGNYVFKQTIPANTYPYISDHTGIDVQPNTDYIVSFDVLNADGNNNWPIQVIIAENSWLGGSFFTSLSQAIKTTSKGWETYSVVFNSGDHSKIWLGAKSQWASATVYFDNFWIAPYHGNASSDGYLTNGDFEADSLAWLHTQNTDVVADPTGAGQGNVMMTDENTGTLHMFSQNATNLVAGEQYTLSFKVYGYTSAVSNAAFFVKFPSGCADFTYGGDLVGYAYSGTTLRFNVNTNLNKWMTSTVTFTAGSDIALIDFQNYRPNGGQYYFDDIVITHVHKWNDATCTAPKTCSVCGETEGEALGHSWTDATCTAPKTCSVCGETEGEALGHSYEAVVTAPDCENGGYTTYTCSVCGDSYVADETEALGHAYAESARTDATCGADGSVTYTCGNCGDSYTETLPATGEHTYDNEFDVDCNVCGAIREVDLPVSFGGNSASEDVSGLAFLFSAEAEGITAVIGEVEADYTNATMGGYKLISMGAKVANAKSEKVIPAVWLYELGEGTASYAVRVINIPAANLDDEITAIPYYVVEIDGVETTVYGEIQTGTYNGVLG